MPKDKERSLNPAAAQRKLDKQKSLKKGKAEAQARRNEKLARRNPERIQRQINDLKAFEESGQKLRPRDQELLEALERDLRAVQKAREALGDKAPKFNNFESRRGGQHRGRGDAAVLGKRRRDGGDGNRFRHDGDDGSSSSDETDEEVRRIPMPRDTPPPIPRQYRKGGPGGEAEGGGGRGPHALPAKPPVVEAKTVYEAKPEIRNLRQEAINKFVPAAVRVKQEAIRGQGKLLEPEEMDRLEQAGYNAGPAEGEEKASSAAPAADDEDTQRRLEEEERRFNQELRSVQIEEVEDEEA
ncbi:WW domain binding protein 11 [Aspergillus piperis CBS 112811]|uniref:WW domain binding protein 11 n=1 Tax=Aspergillus piperis CBS 112811 TaxID=1448313 RepID=A0A8G1VMX9_9EURO|nr:WW domain binding protein 11 [Aspergillus piperis CBS 112811]RAH59181.1 WW domain binding protein 11 [Aspergillus piperis CBS 112811]